MTDINVQLIASSPVVQAVINTGQIIEVELVGSNLTKINGTTLTNVSGILKGNGFVQSAAPDVDYATPAYVAAMAIALG
jgi:hypothetical protein